MKTLLIIEDDALLLEGLVASLAAYTGELRVLSAIDVRQGLEILRAQVIDLLVADLSMSVMDGFELLAFMIQAFPKVPVLVMSHEEAGEIADVLQALGSASYVRKPVDFWTFAEKVRTLLARKARGHFCGISLAGFLQLLHLEAKCCSLLVISGGRHGRLAVSEGELHHAEVESLRGEPAAYEILGWEAPEITMEDLERPIKRTIDAPMVRILMEAAARRDESWNAYEQNLQSARRGPDSDLESAATPEPVRETDLDEMRSMLRATLEHDGAIALVLLDLEKGLPLVVESREPRFDDSLRAIQASAALRARIHLLHRSEDREPVEEMVIRTRGLCELMHPFGPRQHFCLYFLVDGSMDLARAADELKSIAAVLSHRSHLVEA